MYYDSYWESLKFTPAERDAWRAAFPPPAPGAFEIAPRTARRWADAGFDPERARSVFAAAGVDHVAARHWNWTDPETAVVWLGHGFGPEEGGGWALGFSLEEARAWRTAGFTASDARVWADLVGEGEPGVARSWAAAGFDVQAAAEAISHGIPLDVARVSRAAHDPPLGRGNGRVRPER